MGYSVFLTRRGRCLAALLVPLLLTGGRHAAAAESSSNSARVAGAPQIVTDTEATSAERYAAQELRRFFTQAVGVAPVITERPHGPGRIYVGPGKAFRKSALAFDVSGFGKEEFRIRGDGHDLAIVGGRPRGTLYGVYEFLEDYLGVRFLTFDHTYVPKIRNWTFPKVDFRYKPPFSYRWSYYWETMKHPAFAARLCNDTVTTKPKYGGVSDDTQEAHSLQYQVPVAKYGATHPEYFALVNGVRMLHPPDGSAPQVCSTNPHVVDIVTKAVLAELAAHPGLREVSVTTNDNDYYCTCPRCSAIDKREGSPMGAHLTLVNEVAKRVEKVHPGVKILTLAYWYTLKPPRYLRPRHNVEVCVCSFDACGLHPLNDPSCPRNAAFMQYFNGWLAICHDVRFWYYNTDLRYLDLPFPNLDSLGPDVRLLRDRGVRGVFMEGDGKCAAGEMSDLRNYMTSRLLWNPDLAPKALRDEFLRLQYGRAARPIAEYLRLLHDHAEARHVHPYCYSLPQGIGLDAKTSRRIAHLFDEALSLADNRVIRGRVEKAAICAFKPLFETTGHLAYDDGVVHLVYPPDVLRLVPRYRALCLRYGMTKDSETDSLDDYLNSLRNMVAGAPGVRLENASWRVTLIPAFNGDVVDLLYKPRHFNLLSAWDHPGVNLPFGTLHEWGEQGYNHLKPLAFTCQASPDSAVLTKRLADGSLVTRRIALVGKPGPSVAFETAIEHQGVGPVTYQIAVGAELGRWNTAEPSQAPRVFRGHSDSAVADVGFYAPVGLGARIWYDNGQFGTPSITYRKDLGDVELKLPTQAVILGKGGYFRARYRIEYLSREPVELTAPDQ